MFGRSRRSLGKLLLAGSVLCTLFAAALLSAAPQLHEQLHRDAGTASHLCVVTLFSSGHCESVTAAPVAPPLVAPPLLGILPAPTDLVPVLAPRSSILERAPPALA
jgi:hypothetical protein